MLLHILVPGDQAFVTPDPYSTRGRPPALLDVALTALCNTEVSA